MRYLSALLACMLVAACQQSATAPDASEHASAAEAASSPPASATPPTATGTAAASPSVVVDWRNQVWPAHQAAVLASPRIVVPEDADADQEAVVRDARVLLARADRPHPLGDVDGDWQVRSLQLGADGAFGYPWFAATIAETADALRFAKTTGSQRRGGRLLPGGTSDMLVFVGAQSVNDDPIPPYSRDETPPPSGPRDSDSVGRLVRIGPSELLLVLDVSDARVELYHLRR